MAESLKKFQPDEGYAETLFHEHGLDGGATLEEIETTATPLLSNPLTALSGAELVLGRRVDARDQHVAPIVFAPGLSAGDKFALLLMEKQTEANIAEKAKTHR
jgi:hypothetical protein